MHTRGKSSRPFTGGWDGLFRAWLRLTDEIPDPALPEVSPARPLPERVVIFRRRERPPGDQ
jgi:hypothetical protein